MRYLNEIIETAAKKAGSQKELEELLGLGRGYLTLVKAEERGLPEIAQAKLETFMGLDKGSLRAASAIITERDPERKSFWAKLVKIEAAAWKVADTDISEVVDKIRPTKNSKKIIK